MRVNIISIGNSKGIRIPSAVLKQCDIDSQIELEVEKDKIVLKPVKETPRKGWDKAFKLMHKRKEDALLLDETANAEMEDWEWK
ncbi:MAG: AbrB/MazE/SpoVT family DNA-binding domain-containing protein [Nitrospirae bacterium]|nr:AbrB/MazE/SpoVT family DNA-binding domain-containing protein [Nitrospirota bacterium]